MNWDIEKSIIFESKTGSGIYGTSDKKSDLDLRGICVPPFSVMVGILGNFEQKDKWEGEYEDRVVYNIKKFFVLCLSNNPSILELLFIPPDFWVTSSIFWEKILESRDLFLSKRVKYTFSGYASSQLYRIQRHRGYLLNPIKSIPTRLEFGLPANPSLSYEQMSAILTLPLNLLPSEIREEVTKESAYRQLKKSWYEYKSWKEGRSKKRAELEEKFGYDTKHAAHLVRLIHEGKEILEYGKLTFPRPEATLLTEIKSGKFKYDELLEIAGEFDKQFDSLYQKSFLSHSPDIIGANKLYLSILEDYYMENGVKNGNKGNCG